MKFKSLTIFFVIMNMLFAPAAWAHSTMTNMPENGAVLTEAPQTITLNFGKMVKILKLTIKDADDNKIEFTSEMNKQFVNEYLAALPQLTSGEYFISWRGIGKDGHPMKNKFSFTVR